MWKLQITDDKNKVQYEGKFIDRNNEGEAKHEPDTYKVSTFLGGEQGATPKYQR